jgi:hypothetical protein
VGGGRGWFFPCLSSADRTTPASGHPSTGGEFPALSAYLLFTISRLGWADCKLLFMLLMKYCPCLIVQKKRTFFLHNKRMKKPGIFDLNTWDFRIVP